MNKRLLVTIAHPDDEVFGPGGTLAKYASQGIEIHLLCATRGESGQWDENLKSDKDIKLHHIREKELINSARVLGVEKVEFMDFIDGELRNNLYHKIADKIIKKIRDFKPQVIITMDRLGVSGHLDHIAVSLTTTYSFLKTKEANKLYYEVMTKKDRENQKRLDDYFIYFPEGYEKNEITAIVDYSRCWNKKKEAMMQHKSQMKDVLAILKDIETRPKLDYFILGKYRNINVKFPEKDLFAGID